MMFMKEFKERNPARRYKPPHCHAARDGDCDWSKCPQLRDGEPNKTGRDCPLLGESSETVGDKS